MDILDSLLSLTTLTILEIVLGIDNLVFLSILTSKLPEAKRKKAQRWGLTFAWLTRLLLLFTALWLAKLTYPLFSFAGFSFSARDIFLFIGGAFLVIKATEEMHYEVATPTELVATGKASVSTQFKIVVLQIALMDIVFSVDSVLTAVGLTNNFLIMATAITLAILVMIFASGVISDFIEKNPSIKVLALSFLLLIGTVLIAEGLSFHIPRGYIYCSMGFSLSVEALNIVRRRTLKGRIRIKKGSK